MVVLDVAGSPLRDLGHRLDNLNGRSSFELAKDRLVRAAEVVGENVEAAAVGHPDHYLARTGLRCQLNRLVDHRHGHVKALD